jgi:hypothetical protein
MQATDPPPPCIAASAVSPKTVWWSLTAVSTGSVTLSTIGSLYDTVLSVWTGTPQSLANVACNNDISPGQILQSLVTFSATANTKYYILVAPFGSDPGGKTVLNVSNGNPTSLSASPTSRTVAAGSPATFTISDLGAISYALTCSPLPTGAACPAVTVQASQTASLVITTTSRISAAPPLRPNRRPRLNLWPEAVTILGILMSILLAARKRRTLKLIPVSAFALLVLFVAGCGGGGSNSGGTPNPNGTPAGTYSITVTGTSTSGTSGTQTTTVTLTVT